MEAEAIAEAQRKITFAVNSKVSLVSESIILTPEALFLSLSYITS